MSIRLYVGNLPQDLDVSALDALFAAVGEGVRFKAIHDRESGTCRGFGFAHVDDRKLADAVIEQLNGREFAGRTLRIELSERKDSRDGAATDRRGSTATPRKAVGKVVHADSVDSEAPDPRWASELAKLKSLLANQTVGV